MNYIIKKSLMGQFPTKVQAMQVNYNKIEIIKQFCKFLGLFTRENDYGGLEVFGISNNSNWYLLSTGKWIVNGNSQTFIFANDMFERFYKKDSQKLQGL